MTVLYFPITEDPVEADIKGDLKSMQELVHGYIETVTLPVKKKLVKWYNRLESDTSRYQALGNSLAIPCALRVIGGIVDCMTGTGK